MFATHGTVMREVKAQPPSGATSDPRLMHRIAKYLTEGSVQQVCGGVIAPFGILATSAGHPRGHLPKDELPRELSPPAWGALRSCCTSITSDAPSSCRQFLHDRRSVRRTPRRMQRLAERDGDHPLAQFAHGHDFRFDLDGVVANEGHVAGVRAGSHRPLRGIIGCVRLHAQAARLTFFL